MKKLIFIFALCAIATCSFAQEKEKIEKACLNYIEGFYEGDTTKLIAALKPSLFKYGYEYHGKCYVKRAGISGTKENRCL